MLPQLLHVATCFPCGDCVLPADSQSIIIDNMITGDIMNVIYLHGFASSGNSSKSDWLRRQLDDAAHEFFSPDLPDKPREAGLFLDDYLASFNGKAACLIGTSLGGFFAAFYGAKLGWPAVLINPLADVHDLTGSAMGENVNFASGASFILDQADADHLYAMSDAMQHSDPGNTLLLLDKGDDVLDYHKAVARYGKHARTRLFDGGSHRFEHLPESMPEIISLL
ncbi:MAG: hypothetical protein COW18_05270 [Zetaproteobacteria bacterium CG12_big_fil_rev_8_21_14_0_65_54_13]|nr:MAG: hypothetical protein COX55_04525 [Zetaproteobacteria bacterium CG23_combo_of_CG06-09_8_20_14_all_54_7]PIW49628.1 MAG: hypothetical protein COW18_05270 [Zetaproteobacteria bacterium CG12_big_fil_rev_8_21_14_0_65_54_13]PIX55397.1 MAG: hypothetical protein COZ50_02950 [Zetaproteobacteria bacterium CG_4_10_14_3_um_filter_54_28]PJA27565.1 MAG: hypothetical protein CO188_12130 [Zetaproteobacteria bacterium CG_4_9_14_3_um_filter_54_145]